MITPIYRRFSPLLCQGIDELMGMVELVDLLENDTYDTIVLDTAPTGHTVKFLQMPHFIEKWTHLLDLMMEKHRYLSSCILGIINPTIPARSLRRSQAAQKRLNG